MRSLFFTHTKTGNPLVDTVETTENHAGMYTATSFSDIPAAKPAISRPRSTAAAAADFRPSQMYSAVNCIAG